MIRRMLCGLLLLGGAWTGVAEEPLQAVLRGYDGVWEGMVEIARLDGRGGQVLRVRQEYWMEGEIQHALARMEQNGQVQVSESFIGVREGRLYGETMQASGRLRRQQARVTPGGLVVWHPVDLDEVGTSQMSESIEHRADGDVLVLDGWEFTAGANGPAIILIRGELVKRPGERAGPPPPEGMGEKEVAP